MSEGQPTKSYQVYLPQLKEQDVWDEDKFNRNKEQLYKDHEDAVVTEMTPYDTAKQYADTDSFSVNLPEYGESEVWDGAKLARNRDQLLRDHPNAEIYHLQQYNYNPASAGSEVPQQEAQSQEQKQGFWARLGKNLSQAESSPQGMGAPEQTVQPQAEQKTDLPENWEERSAEFDTDYDNFSKVINAKLAEKTDVYKQRSMERESRMGKFLSGIVNAGQAEGGAITPQAREEIAAGGDEEADQLRAAAQLFDSAKKTKDAAYKQKGLLSGLADSATADTWDFGITDMKTAQQVYKLAQKIENNEELTENDNLLMEAMLQNAFANEYYSGQLRRGYKAGQVTGESLPFMLEFLMNPLAGGERAASGGAIKVLEKRLAKMLGDRAEKAAVESAAKAVVKSNLEKFATKAAKGLARGADDLLSAAGMAATTGSIRTLEDTYSRKTGNVQFREDPDGGLVFDGFAGGESNWWKAAAKAYGATTIEDFSEMFGNYFRPIGQTAKKGMYFINKKVGLEKVNNLIESVAAHPWARATSEFLKRTEWNGPISEFGEEVVGGVMNALTVGDQTLDAGPNGVFDKDSLIDTFLGVALFGGFVSAWKTGGVAASSARRNVQLQRNEAQKNKASQEGEELFGDDWSRIQKQIDGADEQAVKQIVLTAFEPGSEYTPEQKRAIGNYAGVRMVQIGLEKGRQKKEDYINEGINEGKTLTAPQEINQQDIDGEYSREKAARETASEGEPTAASELGVEHADAVQQGRREAMQSNIEEGVGQQFWKSEDIVRPAEDGQSAETVQEDVVDVITYPDGHEEYVVSESDGTLATVDATGKRGFATEAQIQENQGVRSSVPLNAYLDTKVGERSTQAEQQRMAQDAASNLAALQQRVQEEGQINVGTPENEQMATVIDMLRDPAVGGVVVQVEGEQQPRTLSWREVATAYGMPLEPKSNAQIVNERINAEEEVEKYNNGITQDAELVVPMEGENAIYQFRYAEDIDGDVIIRAYDPVGGQEVDLTPEMVENLDALLNGNTPTAPVADVQGNPVPEVEVQPAPTDIFNDPAANALGISSDYAYTTKRGTVVVDGSKLWAENPTLWAEWNDRNENRVIPTKEYLEGKLQEIDKEVETARANLEEEARGSQNPDRMDDLQDILDKKTARQREVRGLVSKYEAAEATAAEMQQAAEAQQEAQGAAPQSIVGEEQAAPATAEEILVGTQAALDAVDQQMAQVRSAEDYRLAMEAKADALQQMFDALGAENTVVSTRSDIVEVFRAAGGSEANARALAEKLRLTAGKERLRGFYNNGKIFIIADDIRGAEDANVTQLHEAKHLENAATGAVNDGLRTGVTDDEMRAAIRSLTRSNSYDEESRRALADEVLANAEEIAEREGVEAIPQRLAEAGIVNGEFINFVQKNINNGRRGSQRRHLGGRHALQSVDSEVSGREDVRDTQPQPAAVEGQGLRPDAGGEQGAGGTAEQPAEPAGERAVDLNPVGAPLSEGVSAELREKGLVMDGGAIMDEAQDTLKQETGYKTPNERDTESDPIVGDISYSLTTIDPWARNYLTHPDAKQHVVLVMRNLAERMAADELVYGVVPKGEYKYGQKSSGSKAGPLRTNIEYIVTFDMDTSCPRSLQYLEYVKKIEAQIGRPLTMTESVQLIEMMRVYGQMIPCVYCYCENKRQALKQYYTDFMAARHGVISAKTEEEALAAMYGHKTTKEAKESNDPAVVLNDAAYRVFQQWRQEKQYNPTIRQLWSQYRNDRNVILNVLDAMLDGGQVTTNNSDEDIAQRLCDELRISDKNAQGAAADIVSEWKWNRIEGRPHDDFFTITDEDDLVVDEKTLAVWREMTLYGKSASQAKNVLRYVPYTDELKTLSKADRDYINGMGGLRMHSSNDFRIDYVLDYFQFMADMAAYRMKGHTYTKSPEFVRIFGNSGYKINMSIAAYEDSRGVRPNPDEGFDWETARQLRQQFPNAGTMLMATSDAQIQFALDNDWIDMCIPFHASGLPKAVWYNMRQWTDYSSTQNERFLNGEEMRAALVADGVEIPKDAKAAEIRKMYDENFRIRTYVAQSGPKKGQRFAPHFLPGRTTQNGVNVPGHDNDYYKYIELCRQAGVHPRFYGLKVKDNTPSGGGREVDITEHPRYMIFIKETARTDTPQTPVQFNFDQPSEALGGLSPIDYAMQELQARAMAESEMAGSPVSNIYESYKQDTFGIVPKFIEGIIKHKEDTGRDLPIDYLTPDSREWFMTERRALEEAYKDFDTIPYHPHEYDADGNLIMEDEGIRTSVVGGEENQLTDAQRFAYEFVNGTPAEESPAEGPDLHTSMVGMDALEKDGVVVDNEAMLDEYGLSHLTLAKNGDVVTVNRVEAAEQGQGAGTRFMNELVAEADKNGWILALTPDDTFGATSVSRLKKFYKRFGFKENKGRNTDFTISESMVREPQHNLMFSITTYHGSGADFERFDHSHMSEGEGNQAYGWGTYVASNRKVATDYAERFGEPGDRHLYTVDIPDDNGKNYIHWDKPLTNEQSKRIMNAIRERADKEEWGDEFENELKSTLGPGTYGRYVEGGMDYFLGNEYNYETDENPSAERNAKILSSIGFVGIEIPMERAGLYPGSDYVIFNEDDLKITDNLRFSVTAEQDKEYMDAVEAGDEKKEKKMVKEAAEAAGYTVPAFHGTMAKFNMFRYNPMDIGFHFGDKKTARFRVGREKGASVIPVYLKMENPLEFKEDLGAWDGPYIARYLLENGLMTEAEAREVLLTPSGWSRGTREQTARMREWLLSKGYDSIIYPNWYEGENRPSYAILDPRNVKSAEPVTYDEEGNAISLSERFNPERSDLRFSIRGILGAAEDETAMANLDTAKQMEADGKDAKTIWLATGWEKGADGKWRNEIPDATPKPFGLSKRTLKVEDIVDAPDLFASYPEMKDYKVSLKKMSSAGSFNPKEKEIEMDRDYNTTIAVRDEDQEAAKEYFRQRWAADPMHPADIRKDTEKKYGVRVLDATGLRTVMHELQHAIQDIEGFARGGNSKTQSQDYLSAAYKRMPEVVTFARAFSSRNAAGRLLRVGRARMIDYIDRNINAFGRADEREMMSELRDYLAGTDDYGYRRLVNDAAGLWKVAKEQGSERYNRLAGEVEARNVERRMGLTEEQRRETPISATEDVAREEQGVRFSVVTDPAKIEELENGDKELGYRTVTMNEDGSFGSPKASKLGKKGEKSVKTSSFNLNEWEQSEENPQLATDDGKINLADIGGVDYNPYIHIRPDAINKQFTSAWRHPEQVYIQTSYPTSELSSGYHAEKAKLPVGRHAWTNGDLILSRWDKPERIVPWEEVADAWEQEFKDTGVTFDIVSPNLLPILAERGVEILPPKKAAGKPAMDAYERWKKEQESPRFSITAEQDQEYMDAVNAGDMEKAQRMVDEAAKAAGFDSPKLYHGSDAFGFTSIDTNRSDDGASFWATDKEDVAGSYTKLAITRKPGTEINDDDYDKAVAKANDALDDGISEFRHLIDTHFSEWFFGQQGDEGIRKVIMDANHEPGYGDGVYDVLEDYVAEAYDGYGEDFKDKYEDFADWEENSPEAQEIFAAVNSLEGLRSQIWQLENGELSGGIYELYSNTDNMFVVDAKGKAWNELHPEGLPKIVRGQYKDVPYKTRDVVKWAKENGYDGVIFKNIRDNGEYGRTKPSDVYAFLNPQVQVKSADPVTYDDNGNVIPLSERFNTDNDDIRFSVAYHGSPADFTEFEEGHYREGTGSFHRPGFYFASDEKFARPYAYDRGNGAFLYEVELPDDDGTNYIHVFKTIPKSRRREIAERINEIFPDKEINVERDVVNKAIAGEDLMKMFTNDELEQLGFVGVEGPMGLATMPQRQYIMFNPKDIKMKSKTNVATGDTIRFSIANENQSIFVSNAENAVRMIQMGKATPEQWQKMIEKNGGLKAGEDKWLGLSDWLKASDRKSITKQEILDFIDQNKIRIEETRYAENPQVNDEVAQIAYMINDRYDELASEDLDMDEIYDTLLREFPEMEEMEKDGRLVLDEDAIGTPMYRPGNPAIKESNKTRLYYTTNGLSNKKEIALTVPTIESWNENDNVHFGDAGEGRAVAWVRFGDASIGEAKAEADYRKSEKAFDDYQKELREKYLDGEKTFDGWFKKVTPQERDEFERRYRESSRLYDTWKEKKYQKRRVLFIDEIQSKRHQEGRDRGYRDEEKTKELEEAANNARKEYRDYINFLYEKYPGDISGKVTQEEMDKVEALNDAQIEADNNMRKNAGAIPAAPFEKNWHELAMKRMLRLAAEEGYDYVAWTKGDQQAERYNLSNAISNVYIKKSPAASDLYFVKTFTNSGDIITDASGDMTIDRVGEVFGKDLGARLIKEADDKNGEEAVINGDGLRVGGEGMKGFYDEILPRFVNKYAKKWGVKVEDITLPSLEYGDLTAHAIPVTQEMKESVMEGQLMFSVQAVEEQEDRQRLIGAVDNGGLEAVLGDEGAQEFYRDAYISIPESELRKIVEQGLAEGGNIYAQLRAYMHKLAQDGTENDPTGLLFKLFDDVRYMTANAALTDSDIRYIIWKGTSTTDPGDLLAIAEASAMRKRWGVGEMPMEQQFQEATEIAAENTEERLDAAKRNLKEEKKKTYGPLEAINRAMAAQKTYDKETVDSIVKFAKEIMKNGGVSALTLREANRLLSLINNSTGKSPKFVTRYADQLMDMLLEHTVKEEAAKFDKLVKVKANKVSGSGVEVQGKLDIIGQAVIKAFRENMNSPVEDIRTRMEDATERMDDKDDAIREEAMAAYSGLMLALQYKEKIADNEEEYKDLKNEFNEVSAKLPQLIGRKAYDEFIASSKEALRKNLMERVDMYRELSRKLTEMIGSSAERAAEFRKAEQARVNDIHHDANRDMQGVSTREHRRDTAWQRFLNSDFVRFFLKSLATGDQMFRMLGRKSVDGQGFLFNRYIKNGFIPASERAARGMFDAYETLDAKVSEVFDEPGMKWSDLYRIERKLPGMTVSFLDGGEMIDHELTQGNMLYIYMANKMNDGKMKLRKMGISEEDVQAIKKNLDPRFVELADWMQDEFYVNLRNKYNEVHERMFGAPMAAIEDYVPLKILSNARFEDVDLGSDQSQAELSSTITGSIIKRRRNSLALDILHTDAFSLAIEHVEKMEDWAAFAELRRDINTLLSYKHFRNQVQNMNTVYGSGKTLWNNFKDVCKVTIGKYQPKVKAGDIDTMALNVAKGVTAAKIAFRVNTAIKQLLSFPAYFSDARPDLLMKSIAETVLSVFRKGNVGSSWKWCMENLPLFEKRWKSRIAGDTRLLDTDSDWAIWKDNFVKSASRLGMTPNAAVDALTVAIGAKAMYDTKKAQYLKDGYSEEKADDMAKKDAEILYNQTQQSSETAFVSPVQLDRTVMAVTLTTYRNSSMAYQRQLHDAIRTTARMMKPGYRDRSIAFMKNQNMNNGLSEEDAQRAAERQYNRQWLRNLARVAIFGYGLQFLWKIGNDMWYLLFGDDDDEKQKILEEAALAELAAPLEGLVAGNVISDAWGSKAKEIKEGEKGIKQNTRLDKYGLAQLPLVSDMKSILNELSYDKSRAVNDIINLVVQVGVGVNPQTLSDAVVALIDYTNGDVFDARELAFFLMRVAQLPQSTIEKFLIDEIDMDDPEKRKEDTDRIAKRYAAYKVMKNAPLTQGMYDEETMQKRLKAAEKSFRDKVASRIKVKENAGEEVPETAEDIYKRVEKESKAFQTDLNRAKKDNDTLTMNNLMAQPEYQQYLIWKKHQKGINKLNNSIKKTDDDALRQEWEAQLRDSIQTVINELNENK